MRPSWASVLLLAAMALVLSGALARARAQKLWAEADELAARSRDASLSFAASLGDAQQDSELRLLDERRERTLAAARWGWAGLLSLAVAVPLLLLAWVARELRSFAEAARDKGLAAPKVRVLPRVDPPAHAS